MDGHIFHLDSAEIHIPRELDMRYLYLEITNRCNLHCEMCFKQYWSDEEGDMPYELFLKILDDAAMFEDLKLVYFGGIGEPTVHPRFMDMVREVKGRGYALGLSTNGFLLNERIMRDLVNLPVDLIYLSLDSLPVQPSEIGHIVPNVTLERIKKFAELKKERRSELPHIGVEVVLTKENYKEMGKIAKLLAEYNIDALLFSNLIPVNEEHASMILYDGSVDLEPYLKELIRNSYSGFYLHLPEFQLRTERHCDFVEKKVAVVRWDGEVVPCYRFLHTYPEYVFGRRKMVYAHSFGNVGKKSLSDIWTSKDYSWFRFIVKNAIYPSCTDCPLVDACSYVQDSRVDCWGNQPSCGDCLWARRITLCPIPMESLGKFW